MNILRGLEPPRRSDSRPGSVASALLADPCLPSKITAKTAASGAESLLMIEDPYSSRVKFNAVPRAHNLHCFAGWKRHDHISTIGVGNTHSRGFIAYAHSRDWMEYRGGSGGEEGTRHHGNTDQQVQEALGLSTASFTSQNGNTTTGRSASVNDACRARHAGGGRAEVRGSCWSGCLPNTQAGEGNNTGVSDVCGGREIWFGLQRLGWLA